MKTFSSDGVMQRETHLVNGEAHGLLTMDKNIRKAILDNNQILRRENVLNHLTFGGLELTIPLEDYYNLQKKYPDLKSKDAQTRTLAWKQFMGSSESIPYKVRS